MRQEPGQIVQEYVAKLRSKAEHCLFLVKCPGESCAEQLINYSDAIVTDQVIVGCADLDIQMEILAKHSSPGASIQCSKKIYVPYVSMHHLKALSEYYKNILSRHLKSWT